MSPTRLVFPTASFARSAAAPGGGLATAGGLYFFGEGNGSFNALETATGKKLWSFNCGAGANAIPVSYTIGNRQYIAMGCGGNTQLDFKRGNSVFVFSVN